MSSVRRYLAEIGRRGGTKSRRALDPDTARRMVQIRETRRAAKRRAAVSAPHLNGVAYPADTSTAAGAMQDSLVLRLSPREKLARVTTLSRAVQALSMAGLRQRHPHADADELRRLRTQMLLSPPLAARVLGRLDKRD